MRPGAREEAAGGARAGLRYGVFAFVLGAVLGPVRELFLAPVVGGMAAALAEAAAMAALLPAVARAVLDRLPPRQGWAARAAMAGAGLAVLLLAEAALSWLFEASGVAAARAPRSDAERAVGLLPLLWFALLPFLLRR